jgi:hypothetical protein
MTRMVIVKLGISKVILITLRAKDREHALFFVNNATPACMRHQQIHLPLKCMKGQSVLEIVNLMICDDCKEFRHLENKELKLCAKCNAKRRNHDDLLYPEAKKMFLDYCIKNEMTCPIKGTPIDYDSDVHHKKGRVGYADKWARDLDISLLIDVRYFLAVSRPGHIWIETHPQLSKKLGYSINRTSNEDK